MKMLSLLRRLAEGVLLPLRRNLPFFLFMYVLGVLVSVLTFNWDHPSRFYGNTWWELFLDLYVVCLILALFPKKVRRWLRGAIYAVLYGLALVDVYCYQSFGSTITPSMLMLVGETDAREAGDFFTSLLSPEIIFGNVGFIVLLIVVHIGFTIARHRFRWTLPHLRYADIYKGIGAVATLAILVTAVINCKMNKQHMWRLINANSVGTQEKLLTIPEYVNFYQPIYRLAFSISANRLAAKQVDSLLAAADKAKVDSCSYKSPTIVLIIGESYGKHHSQQYGYFMPTTPRQRKREKKGELIKFTDVVSPYNLTSFVFKNVMSMHVIGQKGEWCDYPLFPELFRKAGYRVTFLTNQFLPQAKDAVYDFSGGFFMNNPKLSAQLFDNRNPELHAFDKGLLDDYDHLVENNHILFGPDHRNLIIFHLIGQHVNYRSRCPRNQRHFKRWDYKDKRPELTDKEWQQIAYYDNAVLYNDSIVDQICRRFEKKNAIVIYMPDHGEECFEGTRGFLCRNHSAEIDYDLARYEFEVPFWVWCSRSYVRQHYDVYRRLRQVRRQPFMTDALPHMLLSLAGIQAPSYHAEYDLLAPEYNAQRPRLLKGTTDYDKLREKQRNNK